MPYPILAYRGNYQVTADIDFSEALLSAHYPRGYREDVIIGDVNGLRSWRLTYSALLKFVPVAESQGRDVYVWSFYCTSKAGANAPFLMQCPFDNKHYLCFFPEDRLSLTLVDQRLRTTGLAIEQMTIKGVTVNADGSFPY